MSHGFSRREQVTGLAGYQGIGSPDTNTIRDGTVGSSPLVDCAQRHRSRVVRAN
jgi:hypothetical protein